jgi:hypothetical protein
MGAFRARRWRGCEKPAAASGKGKAEGEESKEEAAEMIIGGRWVGNNPLCPAPLQQYTYALLLVGRAPRKHLWTLARLEQSAVPNPPAYVDAASFELRLCELAFAILILALRSILARAKSRLGIR